MKEESGEGGEGRGGVSFLTLEQLLRRIKRARGSEKRAHCLSRSIPLGLSGKKLFFRGNETDVKQKSNLEDSPKFRRVEQLRIDRRFEAVDWVFFIKSCSIIAAGDSYLHET